MMLQLQNLSLCINSFDRVTCARQYTIGVEFNSRGQQNNKPFRLVGRDRLARLEKSSL